MTHRSGPCGGLEEASNGREKGNRTYTQMGSSENIVQHEFDFFSDLPNISKIIASGEIP